MVFVISKGEPPISDVQLPGDTTHACTFWVLEANFIRGFKGTKLPFFQEIQKTHPHALQKVTITWGEVVKGTHMQKLLSLSHRWMDAGDPDPDGVQLKALKEFLSSADGKGFLLVWIDAQCMPQDRPEGSRSAEDTESFKTMLGNVNMLFLGTSVLVLLDLSYVSRFWVSVDRLAPRPRVQPPV